jgi:hypothetical protein
MSQIKPLFPRQETIGQFGQWFFVRRNLKTDFIHSVKFCNTKTSQYHAQQSLSQADEEKIS